MGGDANGSVPAQEHRLLLPVPSQVCSPCASRERWIPRRSAEPDALHSRPLFPTSSMWRRFFFRQRKRIAPHVLLRICPREGFFHDAERCSPRVTKKVLAFFAWCSVSFVIATVNPLVIELRLLKLFMDVGKDRWIPCFIGLVAIMNIPIHQDAILVADESKWNFFRLTPSRL